MPERFYQVRLPAFRNVTNQPKTAFHVKNNSAVQHRIRESAESVMIAFEQIEQLATEPPLSSHSGYGTPCKGSFRDRLVEAINPQRVVSLRTAKERAIGAIRDIAIGTGVDEAPMTIEREPDAECIGMAMAGMTRALRSRVDHHLLQARRYIPY